MDDARNLQYGIGFDTADAETSVENLGEKVETLEENIGAVEVGAQQMGRMQLIGKDFDEAGILGIGNVLSK